MRAFIDKEVLPLESDPANFAEHENIPEERLEPVREKARKAGLWAPQSPKEYGGMDLPIVAWAAIYEEAARSLFGPLAINCMAPDDGNMNVLKLVGTPEQKDKWLKPIVEGKVRSSFAMTEPAPGGGSDPSMIRTKAEKKGGKYLITGRKWFITGADGAAHFILMARTSDDKRRGLTAFLFHKDQPGWRIVRRIPILGPEEHGGHCELEFTGLEVPAENVLMGEGDGLKVMQIRLGPARLTHCMRWTGWAKRCLEIAQEYVERREGFGVKLADRESVQIKLGEVAQQIQISRLLTMHAAWMLDQGGRARKEVSMAKVQVADTLHKAADVAIQLQGARGFSKDTVVEWIYRAARAARIVDGASEVHMMVLARFMREEGRDFWQWGPGEGRRNERTFPRPRSRQRHGRACPGHLAEGAHCLPKRGPRDKPGDDEAALRRVLRCLVHFDDVAVRIVEENLLPAGHRPVAKVGIFDALVVEPLLEGVEVVGAEGDVAALHRIDHLAGAEAYVHVLLGDMHLHRAVGDEGDVARIALILDAGAAHPRHRLHVEDVTVEMSIAGTCVVAKLT